MSPNLIKKGERSKENQTQIKTNISFWLISNLFCFVFGSASKLDESVIPTALIHFLHFTQSCGWGMAMPSFSILNNICVGLPCGLFLVTNTSCTPQLIYTMFLCLT